jgi:hypothetical protein
MPIHNLGYREWKGELRSSSTRWLVVAEIGIRRAWQSAWLRRMMFFAWVPGIVMGFMIFIYEQSAKQGGEMQDMMSAGAMALVTHESPEIIFRRIQQERMLTGARPSMGAERHLFWSAISFDPHRGSDCPAYDFAGFQVAGFLALLFKTSY